MRALHRALSAELVKLRGTLALRLCWIAPAVVVGLQVAMLLVRDLGRQEIPTPEAAWLRFAQECLGLWVFLMLPLYVTLQAALLAQLDHGERQWKHLLALACPKWVHPAAKSIVLLAMTAAAFVALAAFIALGGGVLAFAKPVLGIGGLPPLSFLFERGALALVAASCMMAIQSWIAVRWTSFTVAVATGMSATVVGFLVGQSPDYRPFYPWSMTLEVLARGDHDPTRTISISLAGAGIVTVLALVEFVHHERE